MKLLMITLLVLPLFGAAQQPCELKNSSMAHFEAAKLLFESGWKLRHYAYKDPEREYISLQNQDGETLSIKRDIFDILTADKRCKMVGEEETENCLETRFIFYSK